jgi:hypothetical protein
VGLGATAVLIGLLLVLLAHKDSEFPQARSCPTVTRVNNILKTHVSSPSATSESDLLGCFYPESSNSQAVSVSFALPTTLDDPCAKNLRFELAGHEACNVTGTAAAGSSGLSLVVESDKVQAQFSTDLPAVSLDRLEALAVKVLAGRLPPLHQSKSGPSTGRL